FHSNVAELAMAETACRLAVDDQPDPYAGTDRHISEIGEALPASPADLGHGRAVHVGVERDRHIKGVAKPGNDISPCPARLRGRKDMSVGRRLGVQVDWPEAGDAQGI